MSKPFAERYLSASKPASSKEILQTLKWCIFIRHPELAQSVVDGITSPPKIAEKDFLATVLAPVLPLLYTWGTKHVLPDVVRKPTQDIMLGWITCLPPSAPPPDTALMQRKRSLSRWMCSCNQCRGIRRFLGETSDAEEYWLGKVDASKKKHLQMQTDAYAKWAVMEMLAHVLVIRVRAYC